MRLVPETFGVAELIKDIDAGDIAMPEFQRDFIWRPTQVASLLQTVARRWPAGTFLLLEVQGEPEFAVKALKGAPPAKTPRILILDGQQRTTAIYQALTEKSEETYYIRMGAIAAEGGFEDEHLQFMKNSRFAKEYPTLEKAAAQRVIKVSTLADDMEFNKWLRYLPDEEQDVMLEMRKSDLPGIREYEIPAVRLNSGTPLAAIAKIFETLNRTGTRLATFDLMVARLYPYDFKLRDKWRDAKFENAEFADANVQDVDVLKLIALREHMRQRDAGIKITVKGVRESDVLALAPATVINGWDESVQAFRAALDFVSTYCGVVRPSLLPAPGMLLPVAYVMLQSGTRRHDFNRDLERWFWATSFTQTYAQGANTQAVSDARALSAWNQDANAIPEVVRSFRFDEETLLDGRRRNEMLLRGLMCRAVRRDARDWAADKRFVELPGNFEFHHIFPDEYLAKHYSGPDNPVADYCLLAESTNKKIRNTHPKDVLARPDIYKSAVESNLIDASWLDQGLPAGADIQHFLAMRAIRLKESIYEAVGVSMPATENP